MKLWCLGEYHNGARNLHFEAGEIEVADDVAAFLLADAPENFATNGPVEEKSPDAPPRDKAVKKAPRKK